MTDTVFGRKHRVTLFHCQTFGFVGKVRADRIQNRVVVAAAQFKRHRAGDGASHPTLGGFTKHDGLRIKPTTLVEQATQADTIDAILLNRIFIVNSGDQTFISDMKQSHPRGFINTAALCFDNTVFNLIAHAQTVTSANRVGFIHKGDMIIKTLAV